MRSHSNVQICKSYIMEDLTGRVLSIPKQNTAAFIEDDPEPLAARATTKSILEAVSEIELFELRLTHAIENKIVLISDKKVKQRLRNVP